MRLRRRTNRHVGQQEIQVWKFYPARVNHRLRVVNPYIARRSSGEIRRGPSSADTEIENAHSGLNILLKKQLLTGSQIIQGRIMRSDFGDPVSSEIDRLLLHRHYFCAQAFDPTAALGLAGLDNSRNNR